MKFVYQEEDFTLEPRVKQRKKNKQREYWDWYPYDAEIYYKPSLMMAPQKKRDLEEYNFQRIEREKQQKTQQMIKTYLEDQYLPRDIVEDILIRAGFYIPRVLVFQRI